MEERTRLGRGLEEVSRLYLSGRPREAASNVPAPAVRREERRVLRVLHTGSPLVKALFVANFALELARGRRPVAVWDGAGGETADVAEMLEGVISRDLAPDAAVVRLYGLPDISVYGPAAHTEEKLRELAREAARPEEKSYLLVSLPDTVESAMQADIPFDAIVLCPLDEDSLLKAYALIKVITEANWESRIYVVFDDPPTDARGREIFARLAGFARERLQCTLRYLGSLVHDDALERSVEERVPVVLTHKASAARDSITAMGEAFLQGAEHGVDEP